MNMSNGWMKKFDQILIHLFNTSYANESGYRERNETLRKTAGNGGHLIPTTKPSPSRDIPIPAYRFHILLPIDRQTDSINMFYVMYAESMVFIHVVTVLLAGATLFMALDVVKDFGKAEKTFFLPDPHIRLYIVWSRNHYATTSSQPYLLGSPVG